MKLSIVIPVYNEAQTVGHVIDRVRDVDLGEIEKEIIVVDDGSDDGSREIIQRRRDQSDGMVRTHISLINLGKGAAVRMGFKVAGGDIVIVQDADLELDPNEYPLLVAPIVAGEADVVYGSRFLGRDRDSVPPRTRLANKLLTTVTNVLYGSHLTDMETAYKVFRADVLRRIKLRSIGFEIEPEVTARLLAAGYTIVEVPISYSPRSTDEGKKIRTRDGLVALYTLARCRMDG
ncbi:MAG: glycosyltransferase family 2 protein [Anaerolineae bacterium]